MTTAAETDTREETRLVEIWRAEQLELAGYDAVAAAELAAAQHVDLHAAIALLADGCPPDVALKILL
jgi:hypothetical protein